MSAPIDTAPLAPVVWAGWQDCQGLMADFEQWTLTAEIPSHPVGSTLSRQTLKEWGYTVPPAPCLSPTQARERRQAWRTTGRAEGTAHPFGVPTQVSVSPIVSPESLISASGNPL